MRLPRTISFRGLFLDLPHDLFLELLSKHLSLLSKPCLRTSFCELLEDLPRKFFLDLLSGPPLATCSHSGLICRSGLLEFIGLTTNPSCLLHFRRSRPLRLPALGDASQTLAHACGRLMRSLVTPPTAVSEKPCAMPTSWTPDPDKPKILSPSGALHSHHDVARVSLKEQQSRGPLPLLHVGRPCGTVFLSQWSGRGVFGVSNDSSEPSIFVEPYAGFVGKLLTMSAGWFAFLTMTIS